jgi:hypothetical protein
MILTLSAANSFADSGPTFNNNITFQTLNTSTNKTENTIHAVQQTLTSDMLKELAHGSGSFMNNNKLVIAAIAGAYAYGRTFMSIVQANHELARASAWASWKAELPLEALKSQDQETLTKELLFEIQKRHTNANQPADALMPFITFLGAIDEEIAAINHYRSLHFWLESCHATWLFPVNKNRFASASSRLERLWFIKNMFLQWAAEYKLSTLATRSAFSTISHLYHYFANKLNLGSSYIHNSFAPTSEFSVEQTSLEHHGVNTPAIDQLKTDKKTRTKTLVRTVIETVCCAQVAALIGAALSPATHTSTVFNNTIECTIK